MYWILYWIYIPKDKDWLVFLLAENGDWVHTISIVKDATKKLHHVWLCFSTKAHLLV